MFGKILSLIVLVLLIGGVVFFRRQALAPGGNPTPPAEQATQKPSFDKNKFSLSDAASPWVLVNKLNPISPADYEPDDLVTPVVALGRNAAEMALRKETAEALQKMFKAAQDDGIELALGSGYRSYDLQAIVYNGEVARNGQAVADSQSARPGHSEHQTGWAADIVPADGECFIEDCFADTDEGKWVAKNAYKYGFIQRYLNGKEAITGYRPEPWHYRYVGTLLAGELQRTGTGTLEEFFDKVPESQPW